MAKKRPRARTIVMTNQKGGVAKSTTAEAFSASLHDRGYRTLMVDLDSQPGNLSLHVGADKDAPGVYELLNARVPSEENALRCIQDADSFGSVMAANEDLDLLDDKLSQRNTHEFILSRMLAPILRHFDFIILDTPPAFQLRTKNAIVAADDIIIPSMAETSSLVGVGELIDRIHELRQDVIDTTDRARRHDMRVRGVLITMYESTNNLMPARLDKFKHDFVEGRGIPMFQPPIRRTISVQYTQASRDSLVRLHSNSTAARDYEEVVSSYLSSVGHATQPE